MIALSGSLILLGLGFTVLFWVVQTIYISLTSPLRDIPGPWISRYTNLQLKFAVTGGRRIFYIDNLHKKYGPIVRISPTEVAVSDPAAFKQIHAVSSKFSKDIWYEKLTNFPRLSVFTMRNPREHGQRRKLFARGFSKSYLREHWEPTVRRKTLLAVEKIKVDAQTGVADLLKWWTFMATDIVGILGFGQSFGMLELGKKTEYIRVLEAALIGNGIGAEMPWLRAVGSRIPFKPLKEAFNSSAYILGYGTIAVENARKGGQDSNLMATIMAEAEKGETHVDDMDVRTESTSLIFAGSGTTANTMTFLSWAVISRPQLRAALEEEVAKLHDNFTDADLEQLPLLNAVIHETLRLYCAVPGSLPRVVPESGATLNGYFVPQGTTVSTQAYTMHRDENLWPNALVYDPSRWLDGKEQSAAAKSTFCAFGAGAYSCLGINLAWMELRYATAFLFRECRGMRIAPSMSADCMDLENYFVIVPKGHKCEVTLQ
ncbi:cytochrome P450 monooxygenase-like protein [Aureobasidium pullulans]|nr:cytochrome P450 monooxygenase-like protein [Aureobasidium pullulans]